MHAPQLIWIVLAAIGLVSESSKSPRQGWAQLISTAIVVALLWWGGFFGR